VRRGEPELLERQGLAPRVLVEAMRQDARREHRTPSAYVAVALERSLGWDDGE
jgi:hypothetical protein